jgi:hypothetical protein
MATINRTGIAMILLSIQQQLIDKAVVPQADIGIVCTVDVPHFDADQDVLIYPQRFTSDQAQADHAGRIDTRVVRMVHIILRTRMELDESNRQVSILTTPSLGHFALEDAILDALQIFFPLDSNGNQLTYEPMRVYTGEPPKLELPKHPGWGNSILTFEVGEMMPLTQNPSQSA